MNNIIRQQLEMLKTLDFQVDGMSSKEIPESFSKITFFKNKLNSVNVDEKKIQFEKYVLDEFMNDFHKKFNKGNKPSDLIMYGNILKESEKMNYIRVRSADNNSVFEGWIPKKSMKIL